MKLNETARLTIKLIPAKLKGWIMELLNSIGSLGLPRKQYVQRSLKQLNTIDVAHGFATDKRNLRGDIETGEIEKLRHLDVDLMSRLK